MTKITIPFTLASLLYASIWYTPLAHSSWNQAPTSSYTPPARSIFYTPPAHSSWNQAAPLRTTSEFESSMGLSPEMQAYGFTVDKLAPFAGLMDRTKKHGTSHDVSALSTLIAENLLTRNQLAQMSDQFTQQNKQHRATYGALAVANKIIEDLYKQIGQLSQQSKTTQRELTTTQQQEQTTTDLSNLEMSIVAHAREFDTKQHKLAAFMQRARHEQCAAREREQILADELATVKTALASTQHELEDIKRHPQILLPLYHFSEELESIDPTA